MQDSNIILTSGGFNDLFNFVSEDNVKLFKKISNGKKVLIISNAAPEGTGNYPSIEKIKQNFLSIGAVRVDSAEITNSNTQVLMDYDVIYGAGGDPFYLIELVNKTNFKEHLLKFLENGIYIGESAGSIILCENLEWLYTLKKGTKPKYDIKLETYRGLGITGYKVFPHWNKSSEEMKEKTDRYEEENDTEISRLSDGEVIITNFSA